MQMDSIEVLVVIIGNINSVPQNTASVELQSHPTNFMYQLNSVCVERCMKFYKIPSFLTKPEHSHFVKIVSLEIFSILYFVINFFQYFITSSFGSFSQEIFIVSSHAICMQCIIN